MSEQPTPIIDGEVLNVDDLVITTKGAGAIEKLTVPLRPKVDPAGEQYSVDVDAIEFGSLLPFIVTLDNGKWIYGTQILGRFP